MDIGDYIYIIIGVLWFLFSIIGGVAKAKRKRAGQTVSEKTTLPESETEQDVRKMLEDLMQGKQVRKKEIRPVKESVAAPKKKPSKLEIHQEHKDFLTEKREKSKKHLAGKKKSLSSLSATPFSTTSHQQHPPDQLPAEQVAEIVEQFRDVRSGKHPLMVDFDAQKALIFSEVFNRRFH
ncbi:MAG: hypothetical protein IT233_06200 [Bacteroidia bacterium]|nr:hypothetical protein [Bacteroidia bacterium]